MIMRSFRTISCERYLPSVKAGSLVHLCSFLFLCFVETHQTEPHLIWIWSQMTEALINLPAGLLVPSQY